MDISRFTNTHRHCNPPQNQASATFVTNGRTVPFLVGAKAREQGAASPLSRFHYAQPGQNDVELTSGSALHDQLFADGARAWYEWRTPYFRGLTGPTYAGFIKALDRFFGPLTLQQITATHLRQYQALRKVNANGIWVRPAGPGAINHELNTLQQILRHAQLWAPLANFYRPLPVSHWTPPRVMAAEEAARLYGLAGSRPEWELAYIAATLTINTSASGCELRGLQLKHVHMNEEPRPLIFISSDTVKNEFRARVLPLNTTATLQMLKALQRAARLGSVEPEHYLFPFRVKRNQYDPTRPASKWWIRHQFEELREAAGLPWLRPHDLRHQAITEMLEASVPENTVMALAGHVSKQMLNHYAHIRMPAKIEAVLAIEQLRMQPEKRSPNVHFR